MPPYYITTAIDYVNGKPHIGHAFEKVYADVIARYQRLQQKQVFFVTGTDEHGSKIERTARTQDMPVKDFVALHRQEFMEMAKVLDVAYDRFFCTSDKEAHYPSVHKLWNVLHKKGDLYKKAYKGLYCVGHEAFVTPKDLTQDGKCEMHNASPEYIDEENYFFRLSKYKEDLLDIIRSKQMRVLPQERENEMIAFLEQEVEDVSFSRPSEGLEWGVPVPNDSEHTIYVWVDALINYLSAVDYAEQGEKFDEFWSPDVQVIGKDIVRFHSVIFPAMLLSAGLELPKCILTHGFLSVDGVKMSKSIGNVIDPIDVVEEYGVDALRYYLLAEMSFFKDGDFSHNRLRERYDADLAFGLGNFVSRITSLGVRHFTNPLQQAPSSETQGMIQDARKKYHESMEVFRVNEAITHIFSLMQYGDQKVNKNRVWELPQKDKDAFQQEMGDLAHLVVCMARMLLPIIPSTASTILDRFGVNSGVQESELEGVAITFSQGEQLFQQRPK